MDRQLLGIFQLEVERQCRFGLIAAQDLRASTQRGDTDRVWYSVQALLIAAGNVSKLLWPARSGTPNRGDQLRESLSVPDASPLEPRTFRNHFEHFDERLEAWATSSPRRGFVDANIGPAGFISGPRASDFLRNFDTTNHAVMFRGDMYELRPLIDSLQTLHQAASVWENNFLLKG